MFQEFAAFCEKEGVTYFFINVYTPQQNGMSETLLDRSRSILSHAGLPQVFWAEAITTATYLVNLSFYSATSYKTPFEMWHKQNPDYPYFRMYGCDAYAHVFRESRTKPDPKATKCIFLGYQCDVKGDRL